MLLLLMFSLSQAIKQGRTVFAALAGLAVGLCGVSGYVGFLGFILSQLLVTVWVCIACGGKLQDIIPDQSLATYQGAMSPLIEYILVWIVAHNCVHVFM